MPLNIARTTCHRLAFVGSADRPITHFTRVPSEAVAPVATFRTGKAYTERRELLVKDVDTHVHVFDVQRKPISSSEWLLCVSSDAPDLDE